MCKDMLNETSLRASVASARHLTVPGRQRRAPVLYASVTLFDLEEWLFQRPQRLETSGVTRRHHQFLALLILLGAPLLVSLVTQMIPGFHPVASAAAEAHNEAPEVFIQQNNTPLPGPMPPSALPSTAFTTSPTLDPVGADPLPTATDPVMVAPSLDTSPVLILPGDDGVNPDSRQNPDSVE